MANSETLYPNTTYTGETGSTGDYTGMAHGSRDNESIRERVSNMSNQARDRASEFGRKSADAIDRGLDTAAGKLHDTAESLRMKAGTGGDKMSQFATTAADKLDATARYFRDHHTRDMVSGMESMVRRNPGASLAAALAVGVLIGAAMKRDRY
jgi:ElaB/YqjD/DUF883 family membrane-anchored ribosome-binding protein